MSDEPEYSVCQFFPDGTHEYTRRELRAGEAVEEARRVTSTVGAKIGAVTRVIITDGGDFACFEWKFGEGVTYPPEAKGKQPIPSA